VVFLVLLCLLFSTVGLSVILTRLAVVYHRPVESALVSERSWCREVALLKRPKQTPTVLDHWVLHQSQWASVDGHTHQVID